MNRMTPKFLDGTALPNNYYDQPNPYVNPPSCHVNLLELSRYAKHVGKKLTELTKEEVNRFSL